MNQLPFDQAISQCESPETLGSLRDAIIQEIDDKLVVTCAVCKNRDTTAKHGRPIPMSILESILGDRGMNPDQIVVSACEDLDDPVNYVFSLTIVRASLDYWCAKGLMVHIGGSVYMSLKAYKNLQPMRVALRRGRTCSICRSDMCDAIELDILHGANDRKIAEKYCIGGSVDSGRHAVQRHRSHMVGKPI